MSKKKRNKNWDDGDADLADLIEEITVDATLMMRNCGLSGR